MTVKYSYMDAIGLGFPGIGCHCRGDGSRYEDIMLDYGSAIPPKPVLDAWIKNSIVADMWNLIKTERDRRKDEGGYKVGTNWYHSDSSSRIQQVSLMIIGAALPKNLMWKTMSGAFVLMTPTLAVQIFQSAMGSDMAIFTVAEQKRQAMLASDTPENYDVYSGWPRAYGE